MILVHEWGHFIAGRICNVPVYEFSIGFGPKIIQKKGKKETMFSLRAIPLGGYCAFDEADDTGVMDSNLNKAPLRQRFFIFFAGPCMNIIACFIIIFITCFFVGFSSPVPIVESTTDGFEAQEVLLPGDELLEANGVDLEGSSEKLSEVIQDADGSTITFEVLRDGETFEAQITPTYNEEYNAWMIGITQAQVSQTLPLGQSLVSMFKTSGQDIASVYGALWGLITGKYSINDMSSIVGIVGVMSEYASASNASVYLSLCAYISVNLGILNLLPIPGLDGSKILFGIIEGVTKRRVSEKVETRLTITCMILLFCLTAYLMGHDIFMFFQ